jgi:short-subunit dehydrogenase
MPTALVTGASRGLGAACAARLARDGHDLVLVARDRSGLDRVAASARASGVGVEAITADLTVEQDLVALQDRLDDRSRPVDLLVNNAGVKFEGEFAVADPVDLQAEIDTNITAVMLLTRAALPGMTERGRGAVINVASFAGYLAGRGDAYSATKAWVLAFSDTMAASLAGTGVRMIALCASQMSHRMHPAPEGAPGAGLQPEAVVDACLADLARGRTVCVPGWRYRAVVDVLELPRRTLRTLARLAAHSREQAPAPAAMPPARPS